MELKDFILRAEALSLYRASLRVCSRLKRAGQESDAADLRFWIRGEFDANRRVSGVSGKDAIRQRQRQLIVMGQQRLRDLEKTLHLAQAQHTSTQVPSKST